MSESSVRDQAAEERAAPSATRGTGSNASVWIAIGFSGAMSLRLGGNIVMTGLLPPEVFGLMALVLVFQQGLMMFSDVGIGPSIVQHRRGEEPAFFNTAWTIQMIRGFILWLVALIIAWPLAEFYREPRLLQIIPISASVAIITGCYSTGIFLLQRRIQIKWLALTELATQAFTILVICVWASISPTVWALVAGVLASSTLKLFLSHRLDPTVKNRPHWDQTASKELFHFGKWIFVNTLVSFLAIQGDRLVLGRLSSLATFGIYSVAYAVAYVPVSVLMAVGSSLLFPALSQAARESPAALKDQLGRRRWKLLVLGTALVLGLAVEAPLFFQLLYRDRYEEAGPTAQLMSGWVWILVLCTTLDPALRALGDARSTALAQVVRFLITTCATIVGFHLGGLPGFIAGLAIGAIGGYLVLVSCLYLRGVQVLREDLAFTALIASLAVLACAPRYFATALSPLARESLVQLVLVASLLGIGAVCWRKTRRSAAA